MFDPYYAWLSIPEDLRPPTYYQLLGIAPTEQNIRVIDAACLRQSGFIRVFQTGPNAADANRLLSELSHARNVLIDPARRLEYDASIAVKTTVDKPRSIWQKLAWWNAKPEPSEPFSAPTAKAENATKREARQCKLVVTQEELDLQAPDGNIEVATHLEPIREPRSTQTTFLPDLDAKPRRPLFRRAQPVAILLLSLAVVFLVGFFVLPSVVHDLSVVMKPEKQDDLRPRMPSPQDDEPVPPPAQKPPEVAPWHEVQTMPREDPDREPNSPFPFPRNRRSEPAKKIPPPPVESTIPAKVPQLLGTNEVPICGFKGELPRESRRTGFVIRSDGLILTNRSLVDDRQLGHFVTVNGEQYKANVLYDSEVLDIAILKLTGAINLPALAFAAKEDVIPAGQIRILGFEHFGANCSAKVLAIGHIDAKGKISLDGPLEASADGAPIIDDKGKVIGIVETRRRKTSKGVEACCIALSNKQILVPDFQNIMKFEDWLELRISDPVDALNSITMVQVRQTPTKGKIGNGASPLSNRLNRSRISREKMSPFDFEVNQDLIDEALKLGASKERRADQDALKILENCHPYYRRREVTAFARKVLSQGLNDSALRVLAAFSPQSVIKQFERYLEEAPPIRRAAIIESLGRTKDPDAIPVLMQMLESGSFDSLHAETALRLFGRRAEDALLQKFQPLVKQRNSRILRLIGDVGREKSLAMLEALKDSSPDFSSSSTAGAIRKINDRLEAERLIEFSIDFIRPASKRVLEQSSEQIFGMERSIP